MQVLDDVGLFCVFVYVVDLVGMSRIGRGSEGWVSLDLLSTYALLGLVSLE